MNTKFYLLFCLLLLSIGSCFFLYQESWIIFSWPSFSSNEQSNLIKNKSTKSVTLWLWNKNSFKKETVEIMYGDDIEQNIKLLLNSWFLFLEEEQITDKQIIVQSVALSPSKSEAFISVNQDIFDKSASTYQKLMLIESILKTLKENQTPISMIRFLVHHQPMLDDHLNFDISWPLHGYTTL